MSKVTQFVDAHGRPIVEAPPREGDALDVGFGGNLHGGLMEKLMYAKQVMDLSDEMYPYEKTGAKKTGKLTSAQDEIKRANTTSLKSLKEAINDDDDYEAPAVPIKQLPKSIQKSAPAPTPVQNKVKNKKPLYEDENYVYYAKDGVNEEDAYDVRQAPSLTQELIMATQKQGNSKTLPDMSAAINERMVKSSKLPDVIKQSFLKNPLTPPKITAVLGNGQLDAITEQFKKQKLIKNKTVVEDEVIAIPKRKMVEQVQPIPATKREKIKAQLRPIVEELIREILREKL